MSLVDQLPCGSVFTPAISCTMFKIHSAHTDSPMAKTIFFFFKFSEGPVCLNKIPNPFSTLSLTQSSFTDHKTHEENELCGPTPLWVSTYTSHLLYKAQDPFSACSQSHGQNSFFLLKFLGGTSLSFTDQENQEENELCGPTPLWVSTYTSHLLYKIPNPFSTCRHSQGQNRFRGTVINGLQIAKFVIISEHGGPGKPIV